jgi:hypothetical protein
MKPNRPAPIFSINRIKTIVPVSCKRHCLQVEKTGEEPVESWNLFKEIQANDLSHVSKKKKKTQKPSKIQPPLLPPTLQILRIFPQCQDLHKSTLSSSDFSSFCIFFQAEGFLGFLRDAEKREVEDSREWVWAAMRGCIFASFSSSWCSSQFSR